MFFCALDMRKLGENFCSCIFSSFFFRNFFGNFLTYFLPLKCGNYDLWNTGRIKRGIFKNFLLFS